MRILDDLHNVAYASGAGHVDDADEAGDAPRRAGRIVRINLLVMAIIVVADQITKALVDRFLTLHESVAVVDGLVDLTYVRNRGAAFGLLSDARLPYQSVLLGIVGINMGILASAFARNEFQVVQFIPLLIFPQALLGGTFWAVEELPGYLQPVARTPSAIITHTYLNSRLADKCARSNTYRGQCC